jgi:hypothetical protein
MRRRAIRIGAAIAILIASVNIGGCGGNVGVGLNVDVPLGDHAHVSFGTGRWY